MPSGKDKELAEIKRDARRTAQARAGEVIWEKRSVMKKWNMIIDVAECTNCHLCTLAAMDEYVGNEWPGVAAPMPRHGHKWINILQKERGRRSPMIDIAYVPTMCNHCDNAPCLAKGGGAVKKRDDGIVIIDPEKAKGRKDLVESLPLRPHLVERGAAGAAGLAVRRAPASIRAGSRPAASSPARPARCARSRSRTTRWRAWRATRSLEVMRPEAGTKPRVYYRNLWRYSEMLHRRQRRGGGGRRGRLRRGRDGAADQGRPDGRASHHRQLRRLQIRQARREFRPLHRRGHGARPHQDARRHARRERYLGEIRL